MLSSSVIAFFSLIGLIILHELGHFVLAKKFGVKVEEFGLGYPPRLVGKKIGETIYSINLLPFGAFVKMPGEIGKSNDPRSFSQQSVGKRIWIAFGGVLSFWIVAAILLSVVFFNGAPVVVTEEMGPQISNPQVLIAEVAPESPASNAGLAAGDVIKELRIGEESFSIDSITRVQEITDAHKGESLTLVVQRGEETKDFSLVPRSSPPSGEGPMGVALVRVGIRRYSWYLAPLKGLEATARMTLAVIQGYASALRNLVIGEPSGVQMVGPIGVFEMLSNTQELGLSYFLNFVSVIAIHLAIFNLLPIPAVDGGKMMFLMIEGIRKKPLPEGLEQKITAFSFLLLLCLMIWVTIQDITRLF
ncbi:MAG: PDZ domain-containing protein [Candidatus Nealsonbacteria bacterium]|nr:PDZ domain-containing protein [Candidatus Nealsonbacteria bacterium]